MSRAPQPQNDDLVKWAGRNFARFAIDNDIFCVPVDEPEELNFDEVHDIFERLFGRIVLAPVAIHELDEPAVLDCGYGKGQWIDGVLNQTDGDAWCVGIDIYTGHGGSDDDSDDDESREEGVPVFVKKRWNLNGSFRTSRDPDLRPETYDLINSRFLQDGINTERWQEYVQELKHLLKPGGWLQMVETHNLFQSDSGQSPEFLQRWWGYYSNTLLRMGKNPRIGATLGSMMTTAGFDQVQYGVERLPLGTWARSREQIGAQALATVSKMIRSVTLWPYMQRAAPRLTVDQYETLIQGAQRELQRRDLRLYLNVHFAYGRKPRARRRR